MNSTLQGQIHFLHINCIPIDNIQEGYSSGFDKYDFYFIKWSGTYVCIMRVEATNEMYVFSTSVV